MRSFVCCSSQRPAGTMQELLPHVPIEELAIGLHAGLLHGGGSADMVATLVEASVDVNCQLRKPLLSAEGMLFTVLSLRHCWNQTPLSTYAYHHDGATPLMCCVLTRSFEAAVILVATGARVDLKNSRGRTAEDLARETAAPAYVIKALQGSATACEQLLKQYGDRLWVSV